ncbi:hypothetical protein J6590_057525 [Homalodisca vitripennis]|nr:hypothetical protein J6590_057525 [Homalodisca vitripennis]
MGRVMTSFERAHLVELNATNRISKGSSNQKWRLVLGTHCEVHYALPFLTGSSYSDAENKPQKLYSLLKAGIWKRFSVTRGSEVSRRPLGTKLPKAVHEGFTRNKIADTLAKKSPGSFFERPEPGFGSAFSYYNTSEKMTHEERPQDSHNQITAYL